MLKARDIRRVVDVRTIPRSRHNPQFNRTTLPRSLAPAGIAYTHMAGLGGLRRPLKDSPNDAWQNASFRAFADHMLSEEFKEGLDALIALARDERVVLMCAEALPWRCHRSLIADALHLRGIEVRHIMGRAAEKEHAVTPWLRVKGGRSIYPAEAIVQKGAL
jgi:uncharacterized protein (DUF488 family)